MSSVTTTLPEKLADAPTRMRAEDRRELILEAATAVFGERGYVGTTTDAVAKAAGVSQPYVVRMFGTKEALFLEVLHRALDRLLVTFRAALADGIAAGESGLDVGHRIGMAYADLLTDRGLLLSLMHAFILGSDPVIGKAAREGFLGAGGILVYERRKGTEAPTPVGLVLLTDRTYSDTAVAFYRADAPEGRPGQGDL